MFLASRNNALLTFSRITPQEPKEAFMTNHLSICIATIAASLALFNTTPVARADIFQWEYVNPADPSQGKRQSTALTLDGAGATAEPGANLSNRNLTMAYMIGANLTAHTEFD